MREQLTLKPENESEPNVDKCVKNAVNTPLPGCWCSSAAVDGFCGAEEGRVRDGSGSMGPADFGSSLPASLTSLLFKVIFKEVFCCCCLLFFHHLKRKTSPRIEFYFLEGERRRRGISRRDIFWYFFYTTSLHWVRSLLSLLVHRLVAFGYIFSDIIFWPFCFYWWAALLRSDETTNETEEHCQNTEQFFFSFFSALLPSIL